PAPRAAPILEHRPEEQLALQHLRCSTCAAAPALQHLRPIGEAVSDVTAALVTQVLRAEPSELMCQARPEVQTPLAPGFVTRSTARPYGSHCSLVTPSLAHASHAYFSAYSPAVDIRGSRWHVARGSGAAHTCKRSPRPCHFAPKKRWVKVAMKQISITRPMTA